MLAYGRYIGEIVDYSYGSILRRDTIILKLKHNWECETAKKYGLNEASSHFERGVIAGLIQAYTGRKVRVEEVECKVLGGEACSLTIEFTD